MAPSKKQKKKMQKKKSSKYTTHSCEMCEDVDCDKMVCCDTCELWYHFVCVGLVSIGQDDPWNCPPCIEPKRDKSSSGQNKRKSRQPPTKETKRNNKWHPCQLCSSIDNAVMAQCDVCDLKYHLGCIGLVSVEDQWMCQQCEEDQSRLERSAANKSRSPSDKRVNTSNPVVNKNSRSASVESQDTHVNGERSDPETTIDREKVNQSQVRSDDKLTRHSKTTRSSIRRKTQLELDRIHEERQLREKRDNEYLDSKYRILLEDCSSESDKRSTDRSSFTRSWVQSTQANPPSMEKHDADSSLENSKIVELKVNQQEKGAKLNRILSSSADKLNPRLWLDHSKYFIRKVDQMQLDDATQTSRKQMDKQVGLSVNTTAPAKLNEPPTVPNRHSCPEHDAKLHMFRSQEIKPVIGCPARTNGSDQSNNEGKAYEWSEREIQIQELIELQDPRLPLKERMEFARRMFEIQKMRAQNNQWSGERNAQSASSCRQENPEGVEIIPQKVNLPKQSQMHNDGLDFDKNHQSEFKELLFTKSHGTDQSMRDQKRDNDGYRRKDGECQDFRNKNIPFENATAQEMRWEQQRPWKSSMCSLNDHPAKSDEHKLEPRDVYEKPSLENSWNPRNNNLENQKQLLHNQKNSNPWSGPEYQNLKISSPIPNEWKSSKNPQPALRDSEYQRQRHEYTRHEGTRDTGYDQQKGLDGRRNHGFTNRRYSENCQDPQNQIQQNTFEMERGSNRCSNMGCQPKLHANPMIDNLRRSILDNERPKRNPTLTPNQIAARQVVDKKLRKFFGDPEEWSSWHDKYTNTTAMCGFTDEENLERLEKCLEGKARAAVKSQLSHPAAVSWIVDTLEMLFGRPEVIIKSLVNKIKVYPAVKEDNLESLMEFAFEVQHISATIESLGRENHFADPMLVEELVNKLPVQERKDWARYKIGQHHVTLKTLAIWLYEMAKILSTVAVPKLTRSDERKSERGRENGSARVNVHVNSNQKQEEFVNAHNIQGPIKSPKKKFPCRVCNKDCEKIENCSKFMSYSADEKWKTIIEHKLCKRCLRKHNGVCRSSIICGKNECSYKHHPLMHNDERHFPPNSQPRANGRATAASNHFHDAKNEETMLKIVPVTLHHGDKSVQTYAFLDDGTTISMMEQSLADELGLNGTPEQLCLIWTKKIHRREKAKRVSLEISGTNESNRRYDLKGIRTVNDLHLPIQSMDKNDLVKKYPYLKDVPLTDYENAKPGIIIGSDKPKFGTQLKVVEGVEDNGPIASKTRLGWSVHGPRDGSAGYQHLNHHQLEVCNQHNQLDNEIHQRVKEYFSIENFGVQVNNKFDTESIENQRALDLLRKFTKKIDGKFETGLLWKYDSVNVPDSFAMAMKRLVSLEKQGDKVIKAIGEKIADYISKNYARKLSAEELKVDRPSWYLPVFGVTHPKKPDKLRMVFDAAARVKNISLNSMLLKGPDQLTSIIDILRRFREKYIAVCGDIREMYHQIRIREEDQHFQRFIFRNGERQRQPDVYIMQAMTFGATCSPCTAQYVKNINASEFKVTKPEAVKTIIDNHYVDDMMDGADTEEEAIKLVLDVKTIHAKGGFEIRNFLSNSKKVREAISGDGVCNGKDIMLNSESKTERVLGMWWDMKIDVFTFSLKYTRINEEILNGKRLPTKREVLRTVMSIFDPLGLLSNYLVHLKMLLQEIWRAEIDWDKQIVTDNLVEQWKRWLEILPRVENIRIPRLYSPKLASRTPKLMQLHVFVDASQDAFSAVIYLRIEDENGVDCALVGSKSKVAPLKYLSIPRLELQAAVLGTRLVTSIGNGQRFKIDRRIIWSDSETVLSWINSNHRKYSQFVAHRVGEILESSDVNEWRWIPTKENVADEATKWTKPLTFESSNRWFSGPEFVRLKEDRWPEKKKIKIDCEEEMKAHFAHSALVIPQAIDPERFSKWNRMVRALAYAKRFLNMDKSHKEKPLSQEELMKSENTIFRQAQFEGYPSEMVILRKNQDLPLDKHAFIEKPSPLYDGSPYLDRDGVLRMRWRIDGARDVSQDIRRPIVLPPEGRITMLLVHFYHVRYFHQNHETVFNEIRQRFYIPRLRTVIQKVRKGCQMCTVKLAKVMEPQMGDLPPARLAVYVRPFSYVGIDYFGPMYVTVGKRTEKRWGVLFTCLTIRAVHIELASSLDTNECILVIQNFINLRGPAIEIHSDQGSNLKGADNELTRERKKIDDLKLSFEFTNPYRKWIFTAPTASHMGGSWERLIRSVKSNLEQISTTRTPKESVLRNQLLQVANVINSRPLTYIPLENVEDEALTPNHFILGSSNGNKPPCKLDLDGPYLRKSWKEAQRRTNLFWKRFVREYLPTIARRTKWFKPVKPLEPGDIVLVVDENNPRNTYPKARIVETKVGSNGQVRSAKVIMILEAKTNTKGQICKVRRSELWRPAHKLAKLDVVAQQKGLARSGSYRETGGSVGTTDNTTHVNTGQLVETEKINGYNRDRSLTAHKKKMSF